MASIPGTIPTTPSPGPGWYWDRFSRKWIKLRSTSGKAGSSAGGTAGSGLVPEPFGPGGPQINLPIAGGQNQDMAYVNFTTALQEAARQREALLSEFQ